MVGFASDSRESDSAAETALSGSSWGSLEFLGADASADGDDKAQVGCFDGRNTVVVAAAAAVTLVSSFNIVAAPSKDRLMVGRKCQTADEDWLDWLDWALLCDTGRFKLVSSERTNGMSDGEAVISLSSLGEGS